MTHAGETVAVEGGLRRAAREPSPGPPQRIVEIKPAGRLLHLEGRVLWQHRGLLLVMIMRDLQVLYRQTAMGAGWAIVQPLFAITIFTLVFGHFARMPTDGVPYALFAGTAVILWTYFAEALRRSATALVSEAELIRKIYFPRLIIPLAAVISPLVDLGVALSVLIGLMTWYGVVPGWHAVLALPLLVVTALMALAVGLWLGPVNVRFRDVKHTLPFLIQIWMYASPVVYATSIVPAQWRWAYGLNPMVGLIEAFRWSILGVGQPSPALLATSVVTTAILLLGGIAFFRRMERSFADVI